MDACHQLHVGGVGHDGVVLGCHWQPWQPGKGCVHLLPTDHCLRCRAHLPRSHLGLISFSPTLSLLIHQMVKTVLLQRRGDCSCWCLGGFPQTGKGSDGESEFQTLIRNTDFPGNNSLSPAEQQQAKPSAGEASTKRPSLGGQGPSNLATRAPPLIYKTAAAASKGQSQAQSLAACPTAVTNSSFLWTIASIGATLTLASPLSQPQPPTLALSPLSDSGQNTAHTVCTSLENLKIPAKAGGINFAPN